MSARVPSSVPQPQGAGEDPLTHYSRIFVRFLQLVFATFEKGSYCWEPDDKSTDIIISDQATVSNEVVEKRPAIILSRGAASFGNLAMDQFAGPLLGPDGKFTANDNPATGSKRYTDLVSATMTYNILSREGLEAQRIAWIAMYATRTLKKSLLKAGLHRVGEEIQIGPESAPGSIVQPDANEIIMVSVQVPFYFQDTWTIAPADKTLLNHVSVALTSELDGIAPVVLRLRPAGINGRVLPVDNVTSLNSRLLVGPQRTPKART